MLRGAGHGASVVTANKALLAEDGADAARRGRRGRRRPLLRGRGRRGDPAAAPAARVAAGDRITRVTGIVNGTTNFILSEMDATGAGFAEALDEAPALGYAEADPTADVEGFDAAAKAAILASLAFHTRVTAAGRLPRGHHRGHRRRRRRRRGDGLHRQAARHRERTSPGRRRRSGQRPRAPGDDPAHPPAGRRPRRLQRGLRRGRGGRAAHVLRPRRRRRRRPPAPCSATSWRWPATGSRAAGARASRPTPTCRSGRWARSSRATTSASTWPTGRACWPRSPGLRRARGVDRDRPPDSCGSRRRGPAGDGRASLVVVTHAATDAALCGDGGGAARRCDGVAASTSRHASRRRVTMASPVAWVIEEYRDRLPVTDAAPRWSRCTRATRRWCRRRTSPSAPAATSTSRSRGANPTGSFKDRGMTMAISKAAEAAPRRSSAPPPATPPPPPPRTRPGPG